MDPIQKPPKDANPAEPKGQRRDEWAHARVAFDTAVGKSAFAAAFDRMVDGRATVDSVLLFLKAVNEVGDVSTYSKEILAMRSRFRNLGSVIRNEHLALFLQNAALEVPSLKEPLAAEIIFALRQAASSKEYFAEADSAIDSLLTDPSQLSENKLGQLREVQKSLDMMRKGADENRSVTIPDIHVEARAQVSQTVPSDDQQQSTGSAPEEEDEEEGPPTRFERDIEKGALAIAKVFCGTVAFYAIIMMSGARWHSNDSDETPRAPKIVQPVNAKTQENPAEGKEPFNAPAWAKEPSSAIVLEVPSDNSTQQREERKAPKPKKPRRIVSPVPDASPLALNSDAGETPEAIAAAILSTDDTNADDRLKAILSADLSTDAGMAGDSLVKVLQLLARGNSDDKAVLAISRLMVLARQNPQGQDPQENIAQKALYELRLDVSITGNQARSSALGIMPAMAPVNR